MQRILWIITSLSGAAAVGLGAFGAHGLKDTISPDRMETWETAVFYHLTHTLLILLTLLMTAYQPSKFMRAVSLTLLAGVLIFSMSLYMLVLTGITWLGAITPIGGLAMIAGWIMLAFASFPLLSPRAHKKSESDELPL